MKKNLLSILILALLVVNVILSAITMISVASTNKKTAAVIGDIATVLNLELDVNGEDEEVVVSMADTEMHDIAESLTIPLKKSEDGKDHYALVTVSLALNIKDDGYETYGETIATKESIIKGEVSAVYSQYTKDEAIANKSVIEQEVLERIQTLFDSKFIYKVVLTEMYQ